MNKIRRYGPAVVNKIVELRKEGKTYKQIAKELNIATGTAHAIYQRVVKKGVALEKPGRKTVISQDTFDLVKLLNKSGLETKAIMDITKLSRGTVCRFIKSDTLEEYRTKLRELRLNREKALKAKTINIVETKVAEVAEEQAKQIKPLTFDQYNTIMARLNSLQFDLSKVAETLEKKRFKFF